MLDSVYRIRYTVGMAKPLHYPVTISTRIPRDVSRILRLYTRPSVGEWLRAVVIREAERMRKREEGA